MSLASVIAKWRTGTYVVTRESITFSDGFGIPGAPTVFNIDASVQPQPGRSLVDNGEGRMVAAKLWVWTLTELKLETATTSPDVITIDGIKYRAVEANYFGILSNHWRCIVEKVDVP